MPYRIELHDHETYVEAHVLGEFGGVAEAVRVYDRLGRDCEAKGQRSLLVLRDYAIDPNPEEGRLLMSELTRIDSLAPLRIAYVVPHAPPRIIELVEMANAYRRTMWRVFTSESDARAWISKSD
jgi:hypothetical protein